ncbi:hypothetical protein BKA70DRAFT_1492279 [Coprinopsis sp. MPI-PUGE-AT-0042]|nr:hypothetical protein BKA70DRAFT_1492279 [Coprinopsis sp. MPI-PUGE-AT-0042]
MAPGPQPLYLQPHAGASTHIPASHGLIHGTPNVQGLQYAQPTQVPQAPQATQPRTANHASTDTDDNEKDHHDWPQGDVRREYPQGTEPKGWNETKWVWRSSGPRKGEMEGGRHDKWKCLGVFVCTGCQTPVRPGTDRSSRALRLAAPCKACGTGRLVHVECATAFSYQGSFIRDDTTWVYWTHEGEHQHIRPPENHARESDKRLLDREVARNPAASAHELRTGTSDPASVPLGDITPVFSKASKSRYAVNESKARQNIPSPSTTKLGGFGFLKALKELRQELGEPFVIASSLSGPTYMVFRTKFMEEMIEQSVEDWISMNERVEHRHGFVTDGSHSFFKQGNGVLLSTCVFSSVLRAWVPALYTWIESLDTEHHQAHFHHLFDVVVKKIARDGLRFEKRFLLNVMDFSDAQRKAHEEEYAKAAAQISIPNFGDLAPAAQAAQLAALRTEALDAEAGCQVHFWKQAERVEGTGDLVPPAQRAEFSRLLHKMIAKTTSEEVFDELVSQISREFPNAFGWLSWWLRRSHIGMIFPAKSTIDPDTAAQIPKTSNPVERGHFLLNHASGSDHELLPGIRGLFNHASEFERQFKAVKGGHFTPHGPREYKAPKKVRFDDNDGRAPDTSNAIRGLQPSNVENHALYTQGYQWVEPNSCFFDNGLELLFRAYWTWPETKRAEFRNLLPTDSYLSYFTNHCDRRIKLISSNKKADKSTVKLMEAELRLMQTKTKTSIFDQWLPQLDSDAFHSALCWMKHAVEDGKTCSDVAGFFGIRYQVNYECSEGHLLTIPFSKTGMDRAVPITTLKQLIWLEVLETKLGRKPTIGDYFSNDVLLDDRLVLVAEIKKRRPCSSPRCGLSMSPHSVTSIWPPTLTVRSDLIGAKPGLPHGVEFPLTFEIADGQLALGERWGNACYSMIGRVLHGSKHYTSQLHLGNMLYTYNDMTSKGKLKKSNQAQLLEKRSNKEVYYVYTLTSVESRTSQRVEDMLELYSLLEKLNPEGRPGNPVEFSDSDDSDIPLSHKVSSEKRNAAAGASSGLKDSTSAQTMKIIDTIANGLESDDDLPESLFDKPASRKKKQPDKRPELPMHQPQQPVDVLSSSRSISGLLVPPCGRCGITGHAAKDIVACHLCTLPSHIVCVQKSFPDGYNPKLPGPLFENYNWCCSQCLYLDGGRWDQVMLGSFIAFNTSQGQQKPLYYPARVVSRTGNEVTLSWHEHSRWKAKQRKLDPTFTTTPQKCYTMFTRPPLTNTVAFGGIGWPIELLDSSSMRDPSELELDAIKHRDTLGILHALNDAAPAVMEILSGGRRHPLIHLLDEYMDAHRAKKNWLRRVDPLLDFKATFSLPVLPGHNLLVEEVQASIAQEYNNFPEGHRHYLLFQDAPDLQQVFIQILLQLVVIRKYLQRPPSSDGEIFALSRMLDQFEYESAKEDDGPSALLGRLHRRLTAHEKAFYTALGCTDNEIPQDWTTDSHMKTTHSSTISRSAPQYDRQIDLDIELETVPSLLRVYNEDGSPYIFGSSNPFPAEASYESAPSPFVMPLTKSSCNQHRIFEELEAEDIISTGPRPFPIPGSLSKAQDLQTFRIVKPGALAGTGQQADTPPLNPAFESRSAVPEPQLRQTTLNFELIGPSDGRRRLRSGTLAQPTSTQSSGPKIERKRKREEE